MSLCRQFRLVLIKPSHYDDDGYVIQWFRSSMPSNSLAALYGLAIDCATRQVLGPDTAILVDAYDETNTRIRPERIIRDITRAGAGMVGMVGVQSNQYPRAMDLARRFRKRGIDVAIGGFHVSGTLAMLPAVTPELQEAMDLGIVLYAGEAEDGLEVLLQDAASGTLRPLYNHMATLPNLAGVPLPYLPPDRVARTARRMTTFDAGRGCPFQCSFCTIINVQGRVSRRRSANDVEAIIRRNAAHGVKSFFITDDNFARNKDWEPIFDRLIALRMLLSFWSLSLVEHTHPLEGGYLRRKVRTERRPGSSIVPAWRFWPQFGADFVVKHPRIAMLATRLLMLRHRLKRDPAARDYRDVALTPVNDDGALEMLTVTAAARAAARAKSRPLAPAN